MKNIFRKKIIFIGLITLLSAETKIVDLGKTGATYPIVEENFMDMIENAIKDLDIKKEDIERKVREQVKEQSYGTTSLPFGRKVERYSEKNYQIIPQDIYNPLGRIYKKAGEKVLLNTPVPLDICFIDGTNMNILKNQIEYFDKVVEKQSGKGASCVYMVSNRSVLELNKIYYPRIFYPSKKVYEDRFMVKSIPTYVHIYKYKKDFYSFPINMFKHKVKTK